MIRNLRRALMVTSPLCRRHAFGITRGEDDAPRVGAAFSLHQLPRSIAEVPTRSARLGGGVCRVRRITPTPNAIRLSRAVEHVFSVALARLSRWRLALPPQGG